MIVKNIGVTIIDKHEDMRYTMESDENFVMFKLYYNYGDFLINSFVFN